MKLKNILKMKLLPNYSTLILFSTFYFTGIINVSAQSPTTSPLVDTSALTYQGGFIIQAHANSVSQSNYGAGIIEYNPANHSLFLAGHLQDGAIGEFAIPALVNSTDITLLNSTTVLHEFREILNVTPNPQIIDRVSGMKLYNGKLIINGVEFYDAPANNTHTTLILSDASDITTSAIDGYYELQGAAHIAGWISDIPTEWQSLLGGNYIGGNSSKYAINSRNPMGVSAFVFNPDSLVGTPSGVIPTQTLLDFDLTNPLYKSYMPTHFNALYNILTLTGSTGTGHTWADAAATVGTNDLWTSKSQASYGFIIPGTRTYMTIGSSGGHNSGIGYKATQNNGNVCGGPCPYDSEDYYNYYWLWNVNDLLDVKNGIQQPYNILPYDRGVFNVPFQTDVYNGGIPKHNPITGGTFDPASGLLYLSIFSGGSVTAYARNPAIAVYKIDVTTLSITDESFSESVSIAPNPATDIIIINIDDNILKEAIIYNNLGQIMKVETTNEISVANLSKGIYFVKVIAQDEKVAIKKIIKQ